MDKENRPWGSFEVLEDRSDFKVKLITVNPGQRLSYQKHFKRSEHWFMLEGEAVVTLSGKDYPLKEGESIDIPLEAPHRIMNPSKGQMLRFIEVQRGTYFGEDDIVRLQDDYQRQ